MIVFRLIIDHETVAFKEQFFSGEIKGVVVVTDLRVSLKLERVLTQKSKGVFIFSLLYGGYSRPLTRDSADEPCIPTGGTLLQQSTL